MKFFQKICKRLLDPHLAILLPLIPVCTALLLCSFLIFGTEHPFSYCAYVLSAYTLTVICFRIPRLIRWIQRIRVENKLIHRLTTDRHLQVKLSLYGSLTMNTAYALFQFGLGLYHRSFWFHSLAVYYLLLVVVRFFLLRDVRGLTPGENLNAEYRRYRFCGVILLIMNAALVSIVFFMTYFGRTFTHHFITTIAMAAFTFTSMTVAIVNVIRYRQYHSPVFSASKVISLAAAAVSMLTLEAAMFTSFGDETTEELQGLMTLLTGIGVCLFVMVIAIYMILHATKALKRSTAPNQKEG